MGRGRERGFGHPAYGVGVMKKFQLIWMMGAGVLGAGMALAGGDGWVDLFNGKDLTGWVQRGGKAK